MSPDEWNKDDYLILDLFSSFNPYEQGLKGLEPLLDVIESLDVELRPNKLCLKRKINYSRQALSSRFHETDFRDGVRSLMLARSKPPKSWMTLTGSLRDTSPHFSVTLNLSPFALLREPHHAERRAQRILSFVRELAVHLPFYFGLSHSFTELYMDRDPRAEDLSPSRPISDAFWLNVHGPQMVERIGRQRFLSTPCALMEELPGGAFLWLTRPTPADFDSEEARLAQARALVHLRPELSLDSTLATLRQRSLAFSPIPLHFDPDVAEILSWELDFRGLAHKRQNVERFNTYHPPPVSEWLPASGFPASDVPDVQRTLDLYDGQFAEELIALFHDKVPALMNSPEDPLPRLDWHLWHSRWGKNITPDQKAILIPALGAWLGRQLVNRLGGRWVPRKKILESAVIIGDRAWLPFLRATHALGGLDAPLDSSCTQLFREAQRHARRQAQ